MIQISEHILTCPMKHLQYAFVLFFGLALSMPVFAQPFTHPYHDGTTQVYFHRTEPGKKMFRHCRLDSDGSLMLHTLIVQSEYNMYRVGVVSVTDSVLNVQSGKIVLLPDLPSGFPVTVPAMDSLRVWNDFELEPATACVTRRFDTTINFEQVRAFVLAIQAMRYHPAREFTIADNYGIVLERNTQGDEYYLHSMLSHDISSNWQTKRHRMFPLCEGNAYQYYLDEVCSSPFEGGNGYFNYSVSGTREVNGKTYYGTLYGWLREDTTGVYILIDQQREGQVVSSNVTIGSPVYFHGGYESHEFGGSECIAFVTDTSTTTRFGRRRFIATLATEKGVNDLPLCLPVQEMVENVGILIEPLSRCSQTPLKHIWELRYFSVCGETFGAFVSAPPIDSPSDFAVSPAYPNPASSTDNIHVDITLKDVSDISIDVYNALGQTVYSGASLTFYPGTHSIKLPVQTLTSGSYRITIQTGIGGGIVSRWFIVQ